MPDTFYLFSVFSQIKNKLKKYRYVWDLNLGRNMVGKDGSTELWWPLPVISLAMKLISLLRGGDEQQMWPKWQTNSACA